MAAHPDESTLRLRDSIRDRLEATGQFGRMRAMVLDAALQALKEKPLEAGEGVQLPFKPSEKLVAAKSSEKGQLALSVALEFLEHLGLSYTASVLRAESSITDFHSSDAICTALRVPHSSSSCALFELMERGTGSTTGHEVGKEADSPHAHSESTLEDSSVLAESQDSDSAEDEAKPSTAAAPPESSNGIALKGAEDSTYFISNWKGRTSTRYNQVSGQQVQLEYLEGCSVRILDPLDSATADDCEGGEIIFAACEGSIFLRNCKNVTVHAACKQLRLRDCENLTIHLFTTTDPVIEMSHHIMFRPFHLRLPGLKTSFSSARLDPKVNRFVHVYDFTADEPSLPNPHYTVKYPDTTTMESRCEEFGEPECPSEIPDLLDGRLIPAPSSESGENKSYDIKSGAAAWTAASTEAAAATAATVVAAKEETKPPRAVPVPTAATKTQQQAADVDEYSSFEDSVDDDESEDELSVEEDDDEF